MSSLADNTVSCLPAYQDALVHAGFIHFLQEQINRFLDHRLRAFVPAHHGTAFDRSPGTRYGCKHILKTFKRGSYPCIDYHFFVFLPDYILRGRVR